VLEKWEAEAAQDNVVKRFYFLSFDLRVGAQVQNRHVSGAPASTIGGACLVAGTVALGSLSCTLALVPGYLVER
jgi:hypothetical protein